MCFEKAYFRNYLVINHACLLLLDYFCFACCSKISRVSSRTLTYGGPVTRVQSTSVKRPALPRKIHVYSYFNDDGTIMES